ncbi:hypothetical protein REPUB_Repub18cG0085400 [Reevesia pubescens]
MQSSRIRWTPPARNVFKVNLDGSVSMDFNRGGVGIEALATVKAFSFVVDLGLNDIEVEGDALEVIKRLKTTEDDLSPCWTCHR